MATAAQASRALQAEILRGRPTAIVLSGPWGSGKSFLWQKLATSKVIQPATISLFGVESHQEMKSRVATEMLRRAPEHLIEERGASLPSVLLSGAWQVLKLGGQMADRRLGTNAFSSQIDLFELVPASGIVVCIDDIERAGKGISMRSILGLVNYLVEQKKAVVVLLMDDEELAKSDGDEFNRFKERVVSKHIRLSPRVEDIFDEALDRYTWGSCPKQTIRQSVLVQLLQSQVSNLRTMNRALGVAEAIAQAATGEPPVGVLRFATILVIEEARGTLEDADFYATSVYRALLKDETPKQKKFQAFIRTHVAPGSLEHYVFSHSIYVFIRSGVLDEPELNAELFPPPTKAARAEELLRTINSRDFQYFGDSEYRDTVEQAVDIFEHDEGLTIDHVIVLYGHMVVACQRAALPIPDVLEPAIKLAQGAAERDAENGDGHLVALRYGDYIDEVDPLLGAYSHTLALGRQKQAARELRAAIEAEAISDWIQLIDASNDTPLVVAKDNAWFQELAGSSRAFRHRALEALRDALEKRPSDQFPEAVDARVAFFQTVTTMCHDTEEASEKLRYKSLLAKVSNWAPQ